MSHRKNLIDDLSNQDREDLKELIFRFLHDNPEGDEIIHQHMAIVGSRDDPNGQNLGITADNVFNTFFGSPELHQNLWTGHRYYISKLEDFLMSNGGEKFVPLPEWNADQKIPDPFCKAYRMQDMPTTGPNCSAYNLDPSATIDVPDINIGHLHIPGGEVGVGRPQAPDKFHDDRIHEFDTAVAMAGEITPYHFHVHVQLGGSMVDPMHCSALPLFWAWHAALEDFYHKWTLTKLDHGRSLTVGTNADGTLTALMIGNDGSVWRCWQWWRYSGWSYWHKLGGQARQIVVERDMNDMLDLVALDPTNGAVKHILQAPNDSENGWGDWHNIGSLTALSIAIATNRDGRLELFAVDGNKKLWHNQQDDQGLWQNTWEPLGQDKDIVFIRVFSHQSGVLEVYAIGRDGCIWSSYQQTGQGNWSSWAALSEGKPEFQQIDVAAWTDLNMVHNPLLVGVTAPYTTHSGGGIVPGGGITVNYPSNIRIREVPTRNYVPVVSPGSSTTGSLASSLLRAAGSFVGHVAAGLGLRRLFPSPPPWKVLSLENVRKIALFRDDNEGLNLFAIDSQGRLQYRWKEPASEFSFWSEWESSIGSDTGSQRHAMEVEEIVVASNRRGDPPQEKYGRLPTGTTEIIAKISGEVTWRKWWTDDGWGRWVLF